MSAISAACRGPSWSRLVAEKHPGCEVLPAVRCLQTVRCPGVGGREHPGAIRIASLRLYFVAFGVRAASKFDSSSSTRVTRSTTVRVHAKTMGCALQWLCRSGPSKTRRTRDATTVNPRLRRSPNAGLLRPRIRLGARPFGAPPDGFVDAGDEDADGCHGETKERGRKACEGLVQRTSARRIEIADALLLKEYQSEPEHDGGEDDVAVLMGCESPGDLMSVVRQ